MTEKRRIAVVINLDWTMKHHMEVFAGTQDYAKGEGWESVLWPFPPEVEDGQGRRLYDGVIARATPEQADQTARAGIPLVNVWVSTPAAGVPSVLPDVRQAGRMAGEHLFARGFRRLAFVGYSRTTSSRLQQQGLREVARDAGIRMTSLLVSPVFSDTPQAWTRFQSRLREWAATLVPPVGIAAITDKMARYVANAISELGWSVPEDVAVVGLENEEVVCLNPAPSLTSIDLGWHRVGEQAAALLETLMDGAPPPAEPILLPPATLVPRKSTDAFNVDDDVVSQALRFIAEECSRPIKVRDVVAHVPLSWRSLERRFHECRGTTIDQELRRFRIERAKRLLVETRMLIKQVAEASGFANTRRLCEVFKRTVGVSPRQYRQQRKQGLVSGA